MFYTLGQNNSGGSFIEDASKGIGYYVIIEAKDADEANSLAEGIGIYFGGCEDGIDCDCCGDRWSATNPHDGKENPMIWNDDVSQDTDSSKSDKIKGYIHYKRGIIKTLYY